MNDFIKMLGFYKNPVVTTRVLLLDKDLKWIYPITMYLISFVIAFVPVIIVKLINNKIEVLSTFFYFPLITMPFILILTLTGTTIFKEFNKNFQSHLYFSTLMVSYDFVIGMLLMIITIGLNYLGFVLSPKNFVGIYISIFLISRIIFNLKIYNTKKNSIWIKSLIELIITLILSVTIIGGIATIISAS